MLTLLSLKCRHWQPSFFSCPNNGGPYKLALVAKVLFYKHFPLFCHAHLYQLSAPNALYFFFHAQRYVYGNDNTKQN